MKFTFTKHIGIAVVLGFCALPIYADSASNQNKQTFQIVCVDEWMKKADDAKDKVDYKNFGEKYCGCASEQPLDNDAAIQKAAHVCMSRTLLHDAVDSLEDEMGLSKAKDTDIAEYCQDRWNLVLPKQSDEDKKQTSAYCDCVQPKLMDLIKQSDKITDKQYDENVDNIAALCSGDAVVTAPAH